MKREEEERESYNLPTLSHGHAAWCNRTLPHDQSETVGPVPPGWPSVQQVHPPGLHWPPPASRSKFQETRDRQCPRPLDSTTPLSLLALAVVAVVAVPVAVPVPVVDWQWAVGRTATTGSARVALADLRTDSLDLPMPLIGTATTGCTI